jgi:hypothetical protein
LIRAASEPAAGSESATELRIGDSSSGGNHVCFCSSEPAISSGAAPRVLATIETAMAAQPHESSSPINIPSNAGSPSPPSCSGMWTFMRPSSCAFAITSEGCVWCSSYSAAFGRISFSANSRTSARSSRCSGVSANDTPPATAVSVMAMASRFLLD